MDTIKEKLKLLPEKPGVYLMKNVSGDIIYVGKAKILKNRVRQYFMKSKSHNNKTLTMVSHIADLTWIVTDSEVEALILECNLIKKYRPKYNILLKDDKTFPYIKLTVNEDYPKILMTRRIDDKHAKFYGPFVSSFAVKNTIDLLKKTFQIRSCNRVLPRDIGKERECLNYHIKQCSGPCMGYISKERYRENFGDVIDFLEGKSDKIIKKLQKEMMAFSEGLQFEQAADARDKINYLKSILEKQKISAPKDASYDIVGTSCDEKSTCFTLLFVRDGKLLGAKNMFIPDEEKTEDMLGAFLKQFYDEPDRLPKEILLPHQPDDMEVLQEYFSQIKGQNVYLSVPQKGKKKELVDMAYKNALEAVKQRSNNKKTYLLEQLKMLLGLPTIPRRVEVYDISNTSGTDVVGFMTVFIDGVPRKNEYRKFKIKYVDGQDDYESMKEVIYRRLVRYLEEKQYLEEDDSADPKKLKFIDLPDLIFVDGGANHVRKAKEALELSGLEIPMFGLVKDNKHRTRDITSDKTEYRVFENPALFHLVAAMQEETHNNAVRYHHLVRTKNTTKSELLQIKGVGPKTRESLLKAFGSLTAIRNATVQELSQCVSKQAAENIFLFYHGKE